MVTCRVIRSGRPTLTPNQWVMWHPAPDRGPLALPHEWVFRGLQDSGGDLDDPLWLLAVLDLRGMVWGGLERLRDDETTPAELAYPRLPARDDPDATVHLSVIHAHLTALRAAASLWLAHSSTGTAPPAGFWRLLHAGLREFTPVQLARSPWLDVDLFEAGCWQLFQATQDKAPAKECRNEACGRVFYRKSDPTRYGQHRSTGVGYCTEACRNAQRQRQYRRRLLTTSQG